jgi:hypothetical protein
MGGLLILDGLLALDRAHCTAMTAAFRGRFETTAPGLVAGQKPPIGSRYWAALLFNKISQCQSTLVTGCDAARPTPHSRVWFDDPPPPDAMR